MCALSVRETDENPRGNETCNDPFNFEAIGENDDDPVTYQGSIYRTNFNAPGDVDFYKIRAKDGFFNACVPFRDQCFTFAVDFTLPEDAEEGDYYACLILSDADDPCEDDYTICTGEPDVAYNPATKTYTLPISWEGTCGWGDNRNFTIEVRGMSDEINSCAPYQLTMEVSGQNGSIDDDGTCPSEE